MDCGPQSAGNGNAAAYWRRVGDCGSDNSPKAGRPPTHHGPPKGAVHLPNCSRITRGQGSASRSSSRDLMSMSSSSRARRKRPSRSLPAPHDARDHVHRPAPPRPSGLSSQASPVFKDPRQKHCDLHQRPLWTGSGWACREYARRHARSTVVGPKVRHQTEDHRSPIVF